MLIDPGPWNGSLRCRHRSTLSQTRYSDRREGFDAKRPLGKALCPCGIPLCIEVIAFAGRDNFVGQATEQFHRLVL